MFIGESIRVVDLGNGFAEICFDRQGDAINKFDPRTVSELREAVASVVAMSGLRGVLMSSAKESFIVGADIGSFAEQFFGRPKEEVQASNMASNRVFSAIEALPVPSVVAINGFALGGGLEAALAIDYRVMSTRAQVGLPEVKLGLFPGFRGTVRLPRVAGIAVAIEWITGGASAKAEQALQLGVVDRVVEPNGLRDAALELLEQAARGDLDWRARRATKMGRVKVEGDVATLFANAKQIVRARAPKHQPAAIAALELLERATGEERDEALALEAAAFASIAKTQAAAALVQIFLNEQQVKKIAKRQAGAARKIERAAVLGAGIMGGGIAFTSASRGTPVLLKDIAQGQLDLGIGEARKLLAKQVKSGRLTQTQADAVLAAIVPQLDYRGIDTVDVVVEAVVENIQIKQTVLRELEGLVSADTVIASNTSSLRIDDLAKPLTRPENFVGMHFFNPVPLMPLVEVIRGAKTSETAVATVVSYAAKMGKTPIVVKDGPGFLVNRMLTPYMQAFGRLLADGADYAQVDAAMEAFGWPMGPAYLNDVVGMDTGVHVAEIICAGFPERLRRTWKDPLAVMVALGRLGQKNGLGFYRYETDPAGKPKKSIDPATAELLKQVRFDGAHSFADQNIVERMMLPLTIEAALCLEEEIVGTPAELDMALILGVGLPPYLGGALKYADWLGLEQVVALSDRYAHLGPQYVATPRMREMASAGAKYYSIAR